MLKIYAWKWHRWLFVVCKRYQTENFHLLSYWICTCETSIVWSFDVHWFTREDFCRKFYTFCNNISIMHFGKLLQNIVSAHLNGVSMWSLVVIQSLTMVCRLVNLQEDTGTCFLLFFFRYLFSLCYMVI